LTVGPGAILALLFSAILAPAITRGDRAETAATVEPIEAAERRTGERV
jgi:hypothetical protein